ncbi:DUF4914 family protein [Chitinivibrio alkaliphilus]|uniref:DUF4914 domain-containing protein n=1 Tax=Chitinivibrio alkaliphilus ACht1 TaxID=1313304 RepID=U7D2J7_9BACT|nr:DUF4914 family protein [Chitinivibrio alkaliphilus]ERP30729.1 hypothetical protein CALK_2444 [Chitinivibrio alkaliphilus ACht1]
MIPNVTLPADVLSLLEKAPSVITPSTRAELLELALGGAGSSGMTVSYDVPGKGTVDEAWTEKRSNGIAVNYFEPYMRRRDPECMVIGDDLPTDKTTYSDRFGTSFAGTREETLQWLETQDLCVTAFYLGKPFSEGKQYGGILIAPKNAGFFIGGLADLQGLVPLDDIDENFVVRSVMFVAPPFRHTHYDGKQVVVHNRHGDMHEIFSYNLYPGPSAKKGVYGALLTIGEQEDWLTLHASTVQAKNSKKTTVIMHEGASGAGKSEMLEQPHRNEAGQLVVGKNLVSGEELTIDMENQDELRPLTDDMAMCHPRHGESGDRLTACDAEEAWFLRVDHVTRQGIDPHMEELTLECDEPLIFLNLKSIEGEPIKPWEHMEDEPGVPCPNPRVIMPRNFVPGVLQDTVDVDIRNFGLRAPATSTEKPSYGIVGMVHVLPPALAWIWRLVSPRGHANPSITAGKKLMQSEGVGSYWPFATGKKVTQANLLLRQMAETTSLHYSLTPNQHVGAWKTGFMSEWLGRSVLSMADDSFFARENCVPARCTLLGYTPKSARVGDFEVPEQFLCVEKQPEVGEATYDIGAEMLTNFFKEEVKQFLSDDLDPVGRKIIELFLADASVDAYEGLL